MKKFKTPVAMKVTQEQYERDLKEPLLEMGHKYDEAWNREMNPSNDCNYLVVGEAPVIDIMWHSHQGSGNTYFINHYNPELFLALASMTEGEEGIKGEWVKMGNRFMKLIVDYHPFPHRKATTEELIAHLSKDFVLPEKWYCPYANRKEFDIMNDYFGAGWIYVEPNGTSGCTNKEGCNHWIYKGHKDLINYTEITFEQFKTHVLKNNKTMKDSRFPFTLQAEDAKRIVKIACGDWKEKLVKDKNWGMNIAQDASITISEKFYKQMRVACDDKQNELFDDIFGKDIEEEVYSIGDRFNRRDLEETQVMLCKTPDYKGVFIMLDGNDRGTYYGKGNTIELKSKFTKEDLSQLLHGDFDDMLTKID